MKIEQTLTFEFSEIHEKPLTIKLMISNLRKENVININIVNIGIKDTAEDENTKEVMMNYDPTKPLSIKRGFYEVFDNEDNVNVEEEVFITEKETQRSKESSLLAKIKCNLCNQTLTDTDQFDIHNSSLHHYMKYAEDFCKMRRIKESMTKMKQSWWKISMMTLYNLLLPISEQIVSIQFGDEILLAYGQDGNSENILTVFKALLHTWIYFKTCGIDVDDYSDESFLQFHKCNQY